MRDELEEEGAEQAISWLSDLTLESVILLVFGMFMILFGLLGFWIQAGDLPYNPDGTYGLLLVLISLQIITLGKTPFGTHRRSRILLLLGMGLAVPGTIACFIPGLIGEPVRFLAGLIMTGGGSVLFLHLVSAEERGRRWMQIPGIIRYLAISCGLVYLMEILFGLLSLMPEHPGTLTAGVCIAFGISLFSLAWVIMQIVRRYPRTPGTARGFTRSDDRCFLLRDAALPTQIAVILLLGMIFILFSLLLIPVSQGLIPFSRDSQFGLLMVIMAFQVLALGKTPLGVYERSLTLILIGLVIITLGMYSCMIPGLLTGWMLIPLGAWNILTGSTGEIRLLLPFLRRTPDTGRRSYPLVIQLPVTITLLHLATIFFGINLICPGLVPGIAVLALLFLLGLLFFLLAYILLSLPAAGREDRIS